MTQFINPLSEESDLPLDPPEFVEDINVDEIDNAAEELSFSLCKNLREVYFDEEFMSANPRLKKRLDVELESLRLLIKMRKSDERAHDICLRAVGANTNNASLYKALTGIQSSLLSIQTKMDETVKNINSLLKNIQLEINFDKTETNGQPTIDAPLDRDTTRGSKKFIEQMKEELNREQEQQSEVDPQNLFEDEENENEQE